MAAHFYDDISMRLMVRVMQIIAVVVVDTLMDCDRRGGRSSGLM